MFLTWVHVSALICIGASYSKLNIRLWFKLNLRLPAFQLCKLNKRRLGLLISLLSLSNALNLSAIDKLPLCDGGHITSKRKGMRRSFEESAPTWHERIKSAGIYTAFHWFEFQLLHLTTRFYKVIIAHCLNPKTSGQVGENEVPRDACRWLIENEHEKKIKLTLHELTRDCRDSEDEIYLLNAKRTVFGPFCAPVEKRHKREIDLNVEHEVFYAFFWSFQ